jgi:hypothetical protein
LVDLDDPRGEINESGVMCACGLADPRRPEAGRTYDQDLLTGAARHSDGLDHIRLKGTVKDMKKLPEVCGPGINSGGSMDAPGGKPSRPNLAVQPDEPLKAGSAATGAPTPSINLPSPSLHDAGVAADAAVNVPVPGPGSEHQLPSVGSGSADGHGSGSDVVPPNEGSARAGHDR